MPVPGLYDVPSMNHISRGRSFDDADAYFGNNKQAGKTRGLQDINVLKSLAADNVKATSVAKIKVLVRKRPINKNELTKNEEDIIETFSISLVVHETKLKVDLTEYLENHEFVFDTVLNEEVSNDEVYRETVEPIVPIIFQRIKATCFAYGKQRIYKSLSSALNKARTQLLNKQRMLSQDQYLMVPMLLFK